MSTMKFYQKLCHYVAVIEHFGSEIGTDPYLLAAKVTALTGLQYNPTLNYANSVMDTARKNAREKYLACLSLANLDKHRYEDAVNDLHNDFVNGLRTYPNTLEKVYTFLDEMPPTRAHGISQYMASFAQSAREALLDVSSDKDIRSSFVQKRKKQIKCLVVTRNQRTLTLVLTLLAYRFGRLSRRSLRIREGTQILTLYWLVLVT